MDRTHQRTVRKLHADWTLTSSETVRTGAGTTGSARSHRIQTTEAMFDDDSRDLQTPDRPDASPLTARALEAADPLLYACETRGCRRPTTTVTADGYRCQECATALEERPLLADGGVTWTDLTAFRRDCLEAIATLETAGETPYGLAIQDVLEERYGEVNQSRLYLNLDELVDADLVEKSTIDRRTNGYRLTPAGRRLLETRARQLADCCGLTVTEGDRR